MLKNVFFKLQVIVSLPIDNLLPHDIWWKDVHAWSYMAKLKTKTTVENFYLGIQHESEIRTLFNNVATAIALHLPGSAQ